MYVSRSVDTDVAQSLGRTRTETSVESTLQNILIKPL